MVGLVCFENTHRLPTIMSATMGAQQDELMSGLSS